MGNPIFAAAHIIEKLQNEIEAWQEAYAQYMFTVLENKSLRHWANANQEHWRKKAKEHMQYWLKVFDEQREEDDERDPFQKRYEERLVETSIKEIHELFADE